MTDFEDLRYNGRPIPDFCKSAYEFYQRCLEEFPETTEEAYYMMHGFLSEVNPQWADKFAEYKFETEIKIPDFVETTQIELHVATRTIARCLYEGFTKESVYDAFCVEEYDLILQRHKKRNKIKNAPKERPPTEHIPEGPYKTELKGDGKPLFKGMPE